VKKPPIKTIHVPAQFVDMAQRRTHHLVCASIHFPDALNSMAVSCYLQGLEDGYQAAQARKTSERDTPKEGK